MILGIFLAMGDSFSDMAKSGQDIQFKEFYLRAFAKKFKTIYVFSYLDEKIIDLPKNIKIIPNKLKLHRYLYGFLMPIINFRQVTRCNSIRAYHLSGTPPAIIAKILFGKNFFFNFAYNYEKFARIEKKRNQLILFKILKPLAIIFSEKIFVANKNLLKKLPRNKTVYLPNGAQTNFFRPQNKKTKNKIPIILSVGRLEVQKNFENLIRAVRGIQAKLLIIGSGSQKGKLQDLAQRMNVNLEIIEKVAYKNMPSIYSRSDIFVLPSVSEGSPKVLLEAMSCSLPVIGTKVEGILDIITPGENGVLADLNPGNIRKAILDLTKSPKAREKLGRNARRTVEKYYNLRSLLAKETAAMKQMKK